MRVSIASIFIIFIPESLSGWATLGLKYECLKKKFRGLFRSSKFLMRMLSLIFKTNF